MDTAGNLYGTTIGGGVAGNGTVFKLDSSNSETVLYSFQGWPDGFHPSSTLFRDSTGTLYGVTSEGGSTSCAGTPPLFASGCGTFFQLDSSGAETILYRFQPTAVIKPIGIISDGVGNFYGAALGGGTCCGTVFKFDTAGNQTLLYEFTGQNGDGAYPYYGNDPAPGTDLILDSAGSLYGTTFYGGSPSCGNSSGCGTVFKIDPSGRETVLYAFASPPDGANPSSLIMNSAGELYGTTYFGGSTGNGTIFKIDASGHESVLYQFGTQNQDGKHPQWLIADNSENFYGITLSGGAAGSDCPVGCGTFFELNTANQMTILYSFNSMNEGESPTSLLLDTAGNFYGTTNEGGQTCSTAGHGCGTVFKIVLQ